MMVVVMVGREKHRVINRKHKLTWKRGNQQSPIDLSPNPEQTESQTKSLIHQCYSAEDTVCYTRSILSDLYNFNDVL